MVGDPPSASVADAVQDKVELVVTLELGAMVTADNTGAVLSTLTLSVLEPVPASASVAVAVQVIVSEGDTVEVVSVRLEPVPRIPEPIVQV
jgi:hypothetical protein